MGDGFLGKVALVTGGGSGIGRASCFAFAREGARVAVADVDMAGAEETVRLIEEAGGSGVGFRVDVTKAGGSGVGFRVDVTKAGEVESLVERVVEEFGRLDCAFNNAGVGGKVMNTHEYPEDDWDRVIDVNLKGVWLCMRYEIPVMLRQGGGAIVNTASIYGLSGAGGYIAYNAAKHGVVGVTKTAALEYAEVGIRVNAMCPGYILTPMTIPGIEANPELERRMVSQTPMGRMGKPEEIAEAVVWLCSDGASFVTGHTMTPDGGYMAQ